jgi:hypothetical protein
MIISAQSECGGVRGQLQHARVAFRSARSMRAPLPPLRLALSQALAATQLPECLRHTPASIATCPQPADAAALPPLPTSASPPTPPHSLLGPNFHNRARISDQMMQELMELPGTTGLNELRSRAESLTAWKLALAKGVLPDPAAVDWPQEPFKSKFIVSGRAVRAAQSAPRSPRRAAPAAQPAEGHAWAGGP